jgi:hypothetical protein
VEELGCAYVCASSKRIHTPVSSDAKPPLMPHCLRFVKNMKADNLSTHESQRQRLESELLSYSKFDRGANSDPALSYCLPLTNPQENFTSAPKSGFQRLCKLARSNGEGSWISLVLERTNAIACSEGWKFSWNFSSSVIPPRRAQCISHFHSAVGTHRIFMGVWNFDTAH